MWIETRPTMWSPETQGCLLIHFSVGKFNFSQIIFLKKYSKHKFARILKLQYLGDSKSIWCLLLVIRRHHRASVHKPSRQTAPLAYGQFLPLSGATRPTKRGNVTGHHKPPILPVPYAGFGSVPLEIGVNSLQWFSELHLHPIGLNGGHAHRNIFFVSVFTTNADHCKLSCLTWCRSWNELLLTMPSLYVVQHELATPNPSLDCLRPRTEPGEVR